MRYNLVSTKKGLFPVSEIKEGTEVLCNGKWVSSPKPMIAPVKILTFDGMPTTAFENKFVNSSGIVNVHHKMILNKFRKDEIKLCVRGYLDENRKNMDGFRFSLEHKDELHYWYPRYIQFFNKVFDISVTKDCFIFKGVKFPEIKLLSGNELSERNLEYYLEGFFRRNFHEHMNRFFIRAKMKESDKLVLRLLNISVTTISSEVSIIDDPYWAFIHIKDDFNKKKITDRMIVFVMKRHVDFENDYTPSKMALKIEEGEDWVLPGISPDVNTLNPISNF